MTENFPNKESLKEFIQQKANSSLHIHYSNLKGYEGMVLGIDIIFDTIKSTYDLKLEWISFGLDLYAENLLESYTYRFTDIESLLNYLETKYSIAVTDIPVKFSTDHSQFPNPFKDADKKDLYEANWQRFQDDFRNNLFLDPSAVLYDSTIRLGRFIKK